MGQKAAQQIEQHTSRESLEHAIHHNFKSPQLLLDALTHRSYAYEYSGPGVVSNERLEFLGDAVLGLVASDLLYEQYPDAPEGELTNLRAALVRASTLAAFARAINLGPYLRLGKGEEATGGRERDLLLARAFEALIGALYLDGGMRVARPILIRLLRGQLARVAKQKQIKDDKSLLQELAQAQLGVTPTYRVVAEAGPSHDRVFTVEVVLGAFVAARGEGRSKRQAEQAAAHNALADDGWRGGGEEAAGIRG
jgi:ribonuclease-3